MSELIEESKAIIEECLPGSPLLSVLVVNYNTAHLIEPMQIALDAATQGITTEVIVVDNASRDNSRDVLLTSYGRNNVILNNINVGFGRANNQALAKASGAYVLLLNTDAFVSPTCIKRSLQEIAKDPQIGIVGVRLIDRSGQLQPSCRYFPTPYNMFLARTGLHRYFLPHTRMIDDLTWDHVGSRDCDWVPGCFYLVRRAVIEDIGLFDPRYFLYCEEVDHCKRAKECGWKVRYIGDTSCIHIGGESAASDARLTEHGRQISVLQVESELLFFRKHHGMIGVCSHIFLVALGDLMLAVRSALRRQGLKCLFKSFSSTSVLIQLAWRTALGSVPTR
jgi:GT2 family glycosyltransferase